MGEHKMIYVVMGTTGEYSDREEWPVTAFRDKGAAEALVEAATRRANELRVRYEDRWEIPEGANEYDPRFRIDYTGTSYFIYEVELADD